MIMFKCQDLPHSWKIQTCDAPRYQTNLFFVPYKICTFLLRLKPQKNFFSLKNLRTSSSYFFKRTCRDKSLGSQTKCSNGFVPFSDVLY